MRATVTIRWRADIVVNGVLHLLYQVLYGISICNNCNNDGVCDILKGNMSSSEQILAYVCFIDRTADSCLIQL